MPISRWPLFNYPAFITRSKSKFAVRKSSFTRAVGISAAAAEATRLTIAGAPAAAKRKDEAFLMSHGTIPTFNKGSNRLPQIPETSINLDLGLQNVNFLSSRGFSNQRPEILASFGFEPAFDSAKQNASSPIGEMIDIQTQSRRIRSENIVRLINDLEANEITSKLLAQIRNRIESQETAAEVEIELLRDFALKISNIKRSLNIKSNTTQIKSEISSGRVRRLDETNYTFYTDIDDISLTDRRLDPGKSPAEILIQDLGFSEASVQKFTNTKIIAQLLDDLRVIASSFSTRTFDQQNFLRTNDRSPVLLNKLDRRVNRLSTGFDISDLRSTIRDIPNAAAKSQFDKFQDSLRSVRNIDDRIKLMITMMSKEVKVSSGISNDDVRTVLDKAFGATSQDNIFLKMIGNFGNSVTQPVFSQNNTVSQLLSLNLGRSISLPFEPLRIDNSFISGKEVLVDPITKQGNNLDIKPIEQYVSSFKNAIESLAYVFEATLDVNVLNSRRTTIDSSSIFFRVITIIGNIIAIANSTGQSNQGARIELAIFNHARNDPQLKYLLYLAVLQKAYIARDSDTKTANISQKHSFFDSLSDAGLTKQVVEAQIKAFSEQAFGTKFNLGRGIAQLIIKHLRETISPIRSFSAPPIRLRIGPISFGFFIQNRSFVNISNTGQGMTTTGRIGSILSAQTNNINVRLEPTVGSAISTGTLINLIVQILNDVDSTAKKSIKSTNSNQNPNDYFLDNEQAITKFNHVGSHFFIMAIIEVVINLVSKLNFVSISGINNRNPSILSELVIKFDKDGSQVAQSLTQRRKGVFPNSANLSPESQQRNWVLGPELRQIDKSFDNEAILIRNIVESLLGVSDSLNKNLDDLKRFIDNNKQRLLSLSSENSSEDISNFDFSQVVLAQNLLAEQKQARQAIISEIRTNEDIDSTKNATPFVDDSMILPDVKNALLSLLKQENFLSNRSSNAQILSIGLPAGFIESLRERLGTYLVGQNPAELEKRSGLQNDIIRINVYMQDLLFEDIVFKPQTFTFEVDRFLSGRSFKGITSNTTFDDAISQIVITKSVGKDGNIVELKGTNDIKIDESYGFMSPNEIDEMIKNHTISYLLNVYIKILSGVDFSEDSFLLNENLAARKMDDETRTLFIDLINKHVSQFAERAVTLEDIKAENEDVKILLNRLNENDTTEDVSGEILNVFSNVSDSANVEISNDLVTFLDTFSKNSILFGAAFRRQRLVSPKMFERIFHVLIDPDDFEIDEQETNSTASGNSLFNSKLFQQSFIRNAGLGERISNQSEVINSSGRFQGFSSKLKINSQARREVGHMTLRQFFVTVEQLPERGQLSTNDDVPLNLGTRILTAGNILDRFNITSVFPQISPIAVTRSQDRFRRGALAFDKVSWRGIL